jgi:membrane-bound serine protease (ClpP class)
LKHNRIAVPPVLRRLALCAGLLAAATSGPTALQGGPVVVTADIDGLIHPVSAEYMIGAMDRADQAHAALLVFTLQTPGGLLESTRTIVARLLRASTPVAVFIAPSGARAASAGFVLTMAADVAAMAPGTHLGAAHPVAGNGAARDETTAKKAAEDVAAYVRTLANARHRNVTLAEEAVTQSKAFTEQEALTASPPLIDLIATSLPDLLRQLDGRSIRRFDGTAVVLRTADASIVPIAMTRRQRILSAIAHPDIAYLLLSLGMLGLMIELWTPGAVLPGVVGGLSLLLASFALQLLPVNYAGLLLMLFGLLLLALEIKVTSYGVLAVGGIVSLIFGSLMLMDTSSPELQVSLRLVIPVAVGFAAIAVFLVRLALAAQRYPPATGAANMIGRMGESLTAIDPAAHGRVMVRGEIWSATAGDPIPPGTRVRVVKIDGLTLTVVKE